MTSVNAYAFAPGQGALWGTETDDLNATLVRWDKSNGVDCHTNNEVDVIMVVIAGEGTVRVAQEIIDISAGSILTLLKGTEREIVATSDALVYLNVHKRRRKLMPRL